MIKQNTDTLAPVTHQPEFEEAIAAALVKIDGNLAPFRQVFPDPTTVGNVYPPTQAWPERGRVGGGNHGWTTGFWTGELWLAYELTGQARYREVAEVHVASFRERLAQRLDIDHHDLGFLYTLSCVAAWRLTGSAQARDVALAAADHLLGRYLARAGIIQAWGNLHDPNQRGRIIVDCLMNLPLLHWASQESGDERHHQAAVRHAEQAARHIVRPDRSTYHTFFFDPATGVPLGGKTHQGFSDASCWSRGQAWAVYGFALSHARTGRPEFLQTAREVADYLLRHLPDDLVAYWDLDFGNGSREPRDSSASAIAACGLFELAEWVPGEAGARYRAAAVNMTAALARRCSSRHDPASNALLLHGVYSKPSNHGVDEANLWGDYFYLEALVRATRSWQPYW